MPKGIYEQFSCPDQVSHSTFVPQPHQQKTVDYFVNSKYKGLLLYHKLGSGKTCTTIMIADRLLKERKVKRIFILTPGSLRKGWLTEYCNVCGYKNNYLKLYTFITYNYMVGKRLPTFDYSLVIVDEIHNLINGVKNHSTTPTLIYQALMKSKCRILALSGTPIYNYIYEWPLLGNLLKPNTFPNIIRTANELDTFSFTKDFNTLPDGSIAPKNRTRLNRDLDGIISFYPGAGEHYMPTVTEQPIIKVEMSPEQEFNYWVVAETETKLAKEPSNKLKQIDPQKYNLLYQLHIMAKKNILTRSAGNFLYPAELEKELKDLPLTQAGWIDKKWFRQNKLQNYSRKFVALLTNIVLHIHQKQVVFTFFKNKTGVNLIKSLLGMCGVKAEIFSGDMNDIERGRVLHIFNSTENRHGDLVKVLLITEAGAEGISLLEVRHLHILESSPRFNKINQVIGRVARYKSHSQLPKQEQTVSVWRYWSIAKPDKFILNTNIMNNQGEMESVQKVITDKQTIDEILHEKGIKSMNQLNSFLQILQENSI